jgi:hypothetical protein
LLSRASAEERHLGVLAAQTLQPRSAWLQWFLKVSVTLSLVLVLAVALPWLFTLIDADREVIRTPSGGISVLHPAGNWFDIESEYFFGVALACLAALYVSSVSSNSLWGLLACLPVAAVCLAGMVVLEPVVLPLRRALWFWVYAITPAMESNLEDPAWRPFMRKTHLFQTVEGYLTIVMVGSFTIFVLYLAHRNHRTLERGARRIAIQAGIIAASLVVAVAAYFGASDLAWSIIR